MERAPQRSTEAVDARFKLVDEEISCIKTEIRNIQYSMGRIEQMLKEKDDKVVPDLRWRPGKVDQPEVAVGGTAFVVFKAPGVQNWGAAKIIVTKIQEDKYPGMPWSNDGISETRVKMVGNMNPIMNENTARNVALD